MNIYEKFYSVNDKIININLLLPINHEFLYANLDN